MDPDLRVVKLPVRLLTICTIVLAMAGTVSGADPPAPTAGNLPTVLPVIPKSQPRELGDLKTAARDPISTMLDSVTGGDGVIEVYVGQSRVITTSAELANQDGIGVIASGDPTVIDFDVLPNPRLIRILGKRVGVTDLTFVTADGEHVTYDVHVVFDLPLIQTQLQSLFPEASFTLSQLREHVVIKGQARSPSTVSQIVETLTTYLASMQVEQNITSVNGQADEIPLPRPTRLGGEGAGEGAPDPGIAFQRGERPEATSKFYVPKVINMMRVPGPQQVMLKVTIAELDRTALRRLASNLTLGSTSNFLESIQTEAGNVVGVFGNGDFSFLLDALRENSVTTVLAEPNLVTMSGHTSRFQSGGEFPVPVPQGGINAGSITIQYKPFGVQLAFTPLVEANGEIRLTVEPEVSDIDPNLSVSFPGTRGGSVPGLRTRNATTTVQMREGQTLAIAGLLNDVSRARTSRVPLIGDIPYLGAFFTNDQAESREEELLIVITPHLVSAVDGECPSCLPGQDVQEPNDWEFYLLNRIEGRTGFPHRATTNWDDPLGHIRKWQLEHQHGCGPIGFSE